MALYATVGFRDFRPSIFGKINTVCQIGAVFFVVLAQVVSTPSVVFLERMFLYATFAFTLLSGIHYILDHRQPPAATPTRSCRRPDGRSRPIAAATARVRTTIA